MKNKQYNFIVFEGMDCAGKTSIINMLKLYLEKEHKLDKYVFTREPGSTFSNEAERIRNLILDKENNFSPIIDALLFVASRRLNLEHGIWPSLKEGKIVFSDRYFYSSFVYQGILGNAGFETVRDLNYLITNHTKPDLVIFFDLEPEIVIQRLKTLRTETDRLEHQDVEYYIKLREAYYKVINEDPQRFVIINSSSTLEDLFKETLKILKEREII